MREMETLNASKGAMIMSPASVPAKNTQIALNIISHLENYILGFVQRDTSGVEIVPVKAFQSWCEVIKRKISVDPNFQ